MFRTRGFQSQACVKGQFGALLLRLHAFGSSDQSRWVCVAAQFLVSSCPGPSLNFRRRHVRALVFAFKFVRTDVGKSFLPPEAHMRYGDCMRLRMWRKSLVFTFSCCSFSLAWCVAHCQFAQARHVKHKLDGVRVVCSLFVSLCGCTVGAIYRSSPMEVLSVLAARHAARTK